MQNFTKMLFTFMLLCVVGVTNVFADEEVELTSAMFYNWDGYGADATSTSAATVDFNIGNEVELAQGNVVCGTSTVDYLVYADLTGSTKLIISGTAGLPLRVLMNRQESNNGPLVEKNPVIGDDGTVELDLTEFAYVHLNAIKVNWGSATGLVSSIKLVKPEDPLALPKEALKKAIGQAKLQSPVAKTAESYSALVQAIADAEDALKDAEATAESLANAEADVKAAIAALVLAEGYSNMTKEMFFSHTAQGDEGTVEPGCAYVLFEGSGLPYGLSTVAWLCYADLSSYEKLIITVADGTPRFCFNRLSANGQDNDDETLSEMIDIPNNARSTAAYQTKDEEGKTFTIDLKKMVEEKGFAYLHCIKGANWANVTITGMYLYKEGGNEEPVEVPTIANADFASLEGWTAVNNGGYFDQGNGLIGSYIARENFAAATVDETHLDTEYCIGLECRWASNFAAYTQETGQLPAGEYMLLFDVENVNAATTKASYENRFTVTVGDVVATDTYTEWMNGKSEWTKHGIKFALTEDGTAIISLGYGTGSNNFGASNTPVLYVSHLQLVSAEEGEAIIKAIEDAKEAEKLAANAEKVAGASLENPVDAPFVVNGTFDENVNGWTCTGGFQNKAKASNQEGAFTVPFFENWDPNAKVNKMYQVIECIPNGVYKLNIAAFVNHLADPNNSQFVFANADSTFLTAGEPTMYEVYTKVEDNTLEIGLEQIEAIANWMGIDNVTLTYYGAECTVEEAYESEHQSQEILNQAIEALQAEITAARALLNDEVKTEGRTDFEAAIATANALLESTVVNDITAGVAALQAAEAAFKKANQFIYDGVAYIIDAETGLFIAAGHDWGTRGIVNEIGLDLTFQANEETRTVTIDTRVANNASSHFLGSNLYTDAAAYSWILEYRGFGFWIGNGKQYISIDENNNLVMSDTPREWIIVTAEGVMEERLGELAEATETAPVDATFLLQNPNFNRNDQRVSAWQVSDDCTNKNLNGGNNTNNCAESYHSVFTISQTLNNVPKGVYALTAQGFFRQDGEATEAAPLFFANEETAEIPLKTGSENSMSAASESFANGLYTIEPIFVEVGEDGILTVGVQGTSSTQWVIFDNFQLSYYGPNANFDNLKNAALVAELNDLRTKAADLKEQVEIVPVKDDVARVLAATAEVSGTEEITAAVEALKAVVGKAEASLIAKEVLPLMKEFTETTNVYTEEALEEYYGQWVAKYEDGSLTKAEADALQNPFLLTGWHASITVDNFLLSAWDTNPDFQDAAYYINTWSTEGENDGSDFKVPFFEYWTNDANSLGEKTLTATMNGLEAGWYEVSAWVRVRVKNGAEAPAYGITLSANEGEAVDVAAGDQIGESQMYLGEFTAVGEVGEDGVLKIQFNIAADNNISWLAFKNVMFEKAEWTGVNGIARNAQTNSIYNLNGQKVEKMTKGLFILNGKKVVVK